MAIEFQPMQPDATKIALAYGASEARQKDREFALQSYQAHQAAADRSSALSQEDEHFRAQLQQQAGLESMREQNQVNMQASSQSHQAQMAQLEDTLKTNQLNQAEQMRKNSLERQVEYIRANTGEGKLMSDMEGRAAELNIRTGGHGLNILQMRDQTAQTAERRLNGVRLEGQIAHQTAINEANTSHSGDSAENRIRDLIVNGRNLGPHQWDMRNGQWQRLEVTGGTTNGLNPGQVRNLEASVRREVAQEIRDATRSGQRQPWMGNQPLNQIPANVIDAEVTRRLGVARSRIEGERGPTPSTEAQQAIQGIIGGILSQPGNSRSGVTPNQAPPAAVGGTMAPANAVPGTQPDVATPPPVNFGG